MIAARSGGRCGQRGMLLVEVLVSLLLISLGVLATVAIQNRSISATMQAKARADAAYAANEVLGRMWVDRGNLAGYAGTKTLGDLPNGKLTVAVNAPVVTVTVTWQLPNDTKARTHSSVATIVSN